MIDILKWHHNFLRVVAAILAVGLNDFGKPYRRPLPLCLAHAFVLGVRPGSSGGCEGDSPLLLPKQQMRRLSDDGGAPGSPSVTFAPLGPPADTLGSVTHALGGMRIGAGGARPPAF